MGFLPRRWWTRVHNFVYNWRKSLEVAPYESNVKAVNSKAHKVKGVARILVS